MASSVQPQAGFIGPGGQPFNPGPASWVPQPGQQGMPQPGQNPLQNPFTAPQQQARGPVPQNFQQQFAPPGAMPHPSAFMQDAGFMGAPPPGMQFQNQPQQQPGGQWPSPFGSQHASPLNPQGGQLPGQIPIVNPWGQFQQPQPQQQQQPIANPWAQQPQLQQPPQQQGFSTQPLPQDPSLPQELQGRSFGEMLALYNGMKNVVLRYANGSQQPPIQQAPQQQQQGQQQQGQQQQQQGAPQGAEFWRNPEQNIARLVQEQVTAALNQQVAPMLAPVTQQANMAAIQFARQQVAAEIPGFAQFEPEIWQRLAGADPRTLTNPEIWRITAKNVAFDAMMRGQFQFPRGSQFPPQAPPNGSNPLPNLNGFFTEQPGQFGGRQNGQVQITEQQAFVARQMGMTPEAYLAWSGGTNQQPLNGGRR